MKIIPFLAYDNRYIAEVAAVTDKELQEYLKDRDSMPKAYITAPFIKQYIDIHKLSIDLDKIVLSDRKKH